MSEEEKSSDEEFEKVFRSLTKEYYMDNVQIVIDEQLSNFEETDLREYSEIEIQEYSELRRSTTTNEERYKIIKAAFKAYMNILDARERLTPCNDVSRRIKKYTNARNDIKELYEMFGRELNEEAFSEIECLIDSLATTPKSFEDKHRPLVTHYLKMLGLKEYKVKDALKTFKTLRPLR